MIDGQFLQMGVISDRFCLKPRLQEQVRSGGGLTSGSTAKAVEEDSAPQHHESLSLDYMQNHINILLKIYR